MAGRDGTRTRRKRRKVSGIAGFSSPWDVDPLWIRQPPAPRFDVAADEGLTLSEVVNLALRQSLTGPKRSRRLFRQRTCDLGRPSFDLTKANAVAAALEDEAILRKLARSS